MMPWHMNRLRTSELDMLEDWLDALREENK